MMLSMASVSPEITTLSGPLIAAMATCSAMGVMSVRTFDSDAITETISPPDGNCCINRPRWAISFSPSSKLNTPATQAATYSPTL